MSEDVTPNIAVRARTKNAILEAAMRVLPQNPTASINDIADAAGVGRSTVHRHFKERDSLIEELAQHLYKLSDAAIMRANPEAGEAVEGLRRIIEEHIDIGLALDLIYNEQTFKKKPELFSELRSGDDLVQNTLARAKHGEYPKLWEARVFWTLLRLGSEFVQEGYPRHTIVEAIINTLTSGVISHNSNK